MRPVRLLVFALVTLLVAACGSNGTNGSTAGGAGSSTAAGAVPGTERLKVALVVGVKDGSSNTSWIAVAGADGRVLGTATAPGPRGSGLDYLPAWSPDGSQLAFIRETGGEKAAVAVVTPGGSPRKVMAFAEVGRYLPPVWSPTGTQIAYDPHSAVECTVGKPFALRFTIAQADGGGTQELVALPRPSTLTFLSKIEWSPDGKQLLYVVNWDEEDPVAPGECRGNGLAGSAIYVVNADGSGRREVAGNVAWDAAWSPDANKIAYVWCEDDSCVLRTVDAAGAGRVRTISNDPPGWMWADLAWPQPGSEILHTSRRGLFATDVRTGKTRTVATWPVLGDANASEILAMSQDGHTVVIGYDPSAVWETRPRTLYMIDTLTGSKQKITLRSPTGRIGLAGGFGSVAVFVR